MVNNVTENVLIDYRLYDPTKSLFGNKRDKAKFTTLRCSMSETCPALAQGKCAVWHGLGGTHCPYGRRQSETGYTPRAQKFRSWLRERREQVLDIKQLSPWRKIARIGDYVFFPYPFWSIDMKAVDQRYRHGFFSSPDLFLPADIFTIDLFEKIINARPRAMMGGEITDYQKETVPQIIMHTQEEMPNFYKAWATKHPETAKRFKVLDYTGRKAYLKTVRPGSVFPSDDGNMIWDGERLIVESYQSIFVPVRKCEKCTLTILPSDDTVIEIVDNNQVDDGTKFL